MADKSYRFRLTGVSPYLMHWDNLEGADKLELWQKDPKNKNKSKAGDDRTPAWVWKNYLYNDGEFVAVPEDVIRACLLKAGARVPMKGKTTFKSATQSGMVFLEPYMRFTVDGKQIAMADIHAVVGETYVEQCDEVRSLGFELFAKRARVGQSKHIRVRPRFDVWEIEGVLLVTDDLITKDALATIFEEAGCYIGVGDWRPNAPKSPGPFGRFTADVKAA